MARPIYTPPPVGGPPTVGDPDFAAKADAYLGWFPTHGTFSNNLADWMQNEFFADLVDGTAALPAVRFKNDSNTGLYRAGADQLALTEGGVDRGRIYGRKNVLGVVSQAGGIPTGTIIERGSNANGEYVRFADGTQICIRSITVNTAVATASGGVFTNASDISATHAAAFLTGSVPIPSLAVQRPSGSSFDIGAALTDIGGTATVFRITRDSSDATARNITIHITVVGRWF